MGRTSSKHYSIDKRRWLLALIVVAAGIVLTSVTAKKPIMVLSAVFAGYVLFKEKINESEIRKRRREKILEDYPGFAMKYALLFEAGLTHTQVIERIATSNYSSKAASPLYEEVKRCASEIKGGMSVYEALDNMAINCDVREVTYFINIIKRNLRKGGKDVFLQLKEAARESEKISRDEIRKKAETAGTKLSLPMMLLLIEVFVILIVPVFSSFSFE